MKQALTTKNNQLNLSKYVWRTFNLSTEAEIVSDKILKTISTKTEKVLAELTFAKHRACLLGFSQGQLAITTKHHLNLPDLFFI